MERLPYIDEHSISIGATRERVWELLATMLRANLGRSAPAPLVMLLGLAPAKSSGEAHGALDVGDELPGFVVTQARAPGRLALSGRHRFSRYSLVFEIDADDGGHCKLRAQTWAAFPGVAGHAYRLLVIGSGGHRLVIRRLLGDIARRA